MPLNLRKSAINAKQTINCAKCLGQIAFFLKEKKKNIVLLRKHVGWKNRKGKTFWIAFLIIF